jgi:hypothetical protein
MPCVPDAVQHERVHPACRRLHQGVYEWCAADRGPPRTGTVPGLQRTAELILCMSHQRIGRAALRPGHGQQ